MKSAKSANLKNFRGVRMTRRTGNTATDDASRKAAERGAHEKKLAALRAEPKPRLS